MRNNYPRLLARILTTLVAGITLASGIANLPAADAAKHAGPKWGYDGGIGPEHWAELAVSYHLCRDGRRQSPIDLRTDQAFPAQGAPLNIAYQPDTVDELNNGHTVKEIVHNNSSVTYDGRIYRLVEFHFHSHSEHSINGRHQPLEIHLVHKDGKGHLLVIGVFFRLGEANATLEPMLRHLPSKPGDHEVDDMDQIDLRRLIPPRSSVFTYDGSLTTPPATEGVRWFVYQKPLTLSTAQLKQFQKLYDHNYRPVQPVNGRIVALFRQRAARNARTLKKPPGKADR